MSDYVQIDKTPLAVTSNPEGGGLMLLVNRGISCEGHTQVFSAHCTNTPDMLDVKAEIVENLTFYQTAWDAFVDLMQSMSSTNPLQWETPWETKEALSSVFCCWLIRHIAHRAEKRWEKRAP